MSTLETTAGLRLADGSRWQLEAADDRAARLVDQLRRCMRLSPPHADARRLLVKLRSGFHAGTPEHRDQDGQRAVNAELNVSSNRDGSLVATLTPVAWDTAAGEWMRQLMAPVCRESEDRGGLLVHGALIDRDRRGVILAGPGSAGKTTACDRLPQPWRASCDDTTLVVRDRTGAFLAHPWPTWSRFLFGRGGGSWAVEDAVRLAAIFILDPGTRDRVENLPTALATGSLIELSRQAWLGAEGWLEPEELRAARRRRIETASILAGAVPCRGLTATLRGQFWREIDSALGLSS